MYEQKISVKSASFSAFDQRWTRAMMESEWVFIDGIEVLLKIEAFDAMLTNTTSEHSALITTCLQFIKSSDFEKDGWLSSLSDCGKYTNHRLHGIKHNYPNHVQELLFRVSVKTTPQDILKKLC